MKKLYVIPVVMILVVVIPFVVTSAQDKTAEGRIELGGSFGFTNSYYEGGLMTDVTIMPRVGIFIMPKLQFEPTLIFSNQSINPDKGDSYSGSMFGVLFNVAYHYEGTSDSKMLPFLFAGFGFVAYSGDFYGDEMKMILPTAGAGVKCFITNSALIRGEAFWEHVKNDGGIKDHDANYFGIRAGVSIFIK